jgi:hypothetical protein
VRIVGFWPAERVVGPTGAERPEAEILIWPLRPTSPIKM